MGVIVSVTLMLDNNFLDPILELIMCLAHVLCISKSSISYKDFLNIKNKLCNNIRI